MHFIKLGTHDKIAMFSLANLIPWRYLNPGLLFLMRYPRTTPPEQLWTFLKVTEVDQILEEYFSLGSTLFLNFDKKQVGLHFW
jgi:hypothetical protein